MAKPVLLTVDDDPQVLPAIGRDLRKKYSDTYRVLPASSGAEALDLLRRVQQRNEPIALLLVDHRMPQMTGIEFLAAATKLYPKAKTVLLTAYADTDAAIRAINEVKLDHYLMKPWSPPEQNLYPILDDLLEDWQAAFHPPFEGLRVLGTRWSAKSYEMREFLARNRVPYEWLGRRGRGQQRRDPARAGFARSRRCTVSGCAVPGWTTLPQCRSRGHRTARRAAHTA